MLHKINNKNTQKFLYLGSLLLVVFFAIGFWDISTTKAAASSDVYRFWSETNQGHFYTASEIERDYVIANYPQTAWKYEGVAFQVFTTPQPNTKPVYRFWSNQNKVHFYTISEDEKNSTDVNFTDDQWKLEGVAWYAYDAPQLGSAPVYRFWGEEKRRHFFTFSPAEKTCIQNSYTTSQWGYEGFAYWTPGEAPPNDPDATCGVNLGPMISVGLWSKSHVDAESDPFRITASKNFNVTDCGSTQILQIPVGETARVKYVGSSGMLQVYNSNTPLAFTNIMHKVCLESSDGNDTDMIFDVNTPDNLSKGPYDQYRGKIKIQHSFTDDNYNLYQTISFPDLDLANSKRRVWVINTLPLEQYMWGYGEMKGGVEEHSKALTVTARSYARWYIEYATKWADSADTAHPENGEGFDILSYSFSQIYNGYDYELKYPLVADSVKKTKGTIMKYGTEYVLGAYSSYTDGNTRSFPGYPYMVSVPDPYGKNSNMTTEQMVAAGNHMWGLSASGSLNLASNYGWTWDKILNYYYTGISIVKEY